MSDDHVFKEIWFMGGTIRPEKTVVKVRPGKEADVYRQFGGIEVILADDLPAGVVAIMGHRKEDGSFREGSIRLIES